MKRTIFFSLLILHSMIVPAQRQMEKLDRGLVAYKTENGVLVSWRITANEWDDITFNLYREGIKLNAEPLSGATCYKDPTGQPGTKYAVSALFSGMERPRSAEVVALSQDYFDIPLDIPAGGTTPDGVNYTYSPNDCSTGDLDGDGRYDIVVKWDPSNAKDNSQSGHTGNVYLDGYRLDGTKLWRIDLGRNIRAGAHYTQFMVFDLDGDGKAEVACKTADATVDGTGTVIGSSTVDYRNASGYVLSGPEFLTIFNGETGAVLVTVPYNPARGSVSSWGDNYGNRVDRFLAAVAYLDGQRPSLVMCRGYYTGSSGGRTVLAAWDFHNKTLTNRWTFNAVLNGENSSYTGQGNHNLSVADVDFDGKDEIVYGSCTIDDNGKGLYTTGLGHGDALHVSDFDPARPGLEVFAPHESGSNGVTFRDAATGTIIWQKMISGDTGRGLCCDISSSWPGAESWGANKLGVYNSLGEVVSSSFPSINFAVWWDGDEVRELLDGTSITKWGKGTLLSAAGCSSINGTKSTPNLSADLLGDWREEVILRTNDNRSLRVFLTPFTTERKLYTLMHDSHYRTSVAWQNVAYNQPPHTGFFLGGGMAVPPPPQNAGDELQWKGGNTWTAGGAGNWMAKAQDTVFTNGDAVRFDLAGNVSSPIRIDGKLEPRSVRINHPSDIILEGEGTLEGRMKLFKTGKGSLLLRGNHTYSGSTTVWQGSFILEGKLTSSPLLAVSMATAGGAGLYGNGVSVEESATLTIGTPSRIADTLLIDKYLNLKNAAVLFDLSSDPTGKTSRNDHLIIDGDLTFTGDNRIIIQMTSQYLVPGNYRLISWTGTFTGNMNQMEVQGITGVSHELTTEDKSLVLKISALRQPATLIWEGALSADWNLATDKNWKMNNNPEWFVTNDTVVFNDLGSVKEVELKGVLPVGKVMVESSENYQFSGTGAMAGDGWLVKAGTGRLTIWNANQYTGKALKDTGLPGAGTLVENGTLVVSNSTGSATGSGSVVVRSNAILSGTGIITGPLVAEDGAGISPGGAAIGTLTIRQGASFSEKAKMSVKCNPLSQTADIIKSSARVNLGGILFITNMTASSFSSGMKFRIIEAPEITGNFQLIIPSSPGNGLAWDTSELTTTGYIKVVPFTSAALIPEKSLFRVFPNPVNDLLNIHTDQAGKEIHAYLFDTTGRLCLLEKFYGNSDCVLDLKSCIPGIYHLMITDLNSAGSVQIIRR